MLEKRDFVTSLVIFQCYFSRRGTEKESCQVTLVIFQRVKPQGFFFFPEAIARPGKGWLPWSHVNCQFRKALVSRSQGQSLLYFPTLLSKFTWANTECKVIQYFATIHILHLPFVFQIYTLPTQKALALVWPWGFSVYLLLLMVPLSMSFLVIFQIFYLLFCWRQKLDWKHGYLQDHFFSESHSLFLKLSISPQISLLFQK